jgi:hypothetical protein
VKLFSESSIKMPRMNTDHPSQEPPPSISAPYAAWLDDGGACTLPPPSHVREHRDEAFTSTVDGVVQRADGEHLWLRAASGAGAEGGERGDDAGAFDVCVAHGLPAGIDLALLVGQPVRATVVHEEGGFASHGRTLTINGHNGRVWLIARSGTVQGVTHALSAASTEPVIHAALSQRPLGPLVIGTSELQRLVPVGESAILRMPGGSVFRALLVERRPDGTASYVIADDALVLDGLS